MELSSTRKVRLLFIKPKPRLTLFLVISLGVHLLAVLIHYFIPEKVVENTFTKPVKVRFLPPGREVPRKSTFVKTLRLKKKESTKVKRIKSEFDSRDHSKMNTKNHKVMNSKSVGVLLLENKKSRKKPKMSKIPSYSQNKISNKKNPGSKMNKLRITQSGKKKTEFFVPPLKESNPISVMAMLRNLDTSKYIPLGNEPLDNDDDEPISLDTKEVKYADYFSRIKFQIEQVWIYPLEAARRGISGEIILKFKLSNDGSLIGIRMMKSSGTKVLDQAALQAVKKAAPYYPFPSEITREKITILATFIYSPTYANNVDPYR